MASPEHRYSFENGGIQQEGTSYYFMSEGANPQLKVVQYTYIGLKGLRPTYNLGFGTLNPIQGALEDDNISGNGDAYKVFNTVLYTIPDFFRNYPEAMVMVSGSDSRDGYSDICRANCRKRCIPPNCRNLHRRINIYKNFLNKNLTLLSTDYHFWGGMKHPNDQHITEEYGPINKYDTIFFIRK